MRSERRKGFVSKAPKRGNMLAQGVNPRLEAPSPRLRHPLLRGRERGWGEGGSLNPTARRRGLGYAAPTELIYAMNCVYRTLTQVYGKERVCFHAIKGSYHHRDAGQARCGQEGGKACAI